MPKPPKYLLQFFRWFCDPELHPFIEGDLIELYQENEERLGKSKARVRFALDILFLFRPGIIRVWRFSQKRLTMDLIKHSFVISIRSFKRYPISFGINLLGLTASLASVILIGLWVYDELQVDKFHEKDDRLFHILENVHYKEGILTENETADPLYAALEEQFPEVEQAVAVNYFTGDFSGEGVASTSDKNIKVKGAFSTASFFEVFSYELIEGKVEDVLAEKNGVVISQALAERLFVPGQSPIGQLIEFKHRRGLNGPFYVSGVFAAPPSSASHQFDIVFNFEKLLEADRFAGQWNSRLTQTYVILQAGTAIADFNAKITHFFRSKNKKARERGNTLFAQQYSRAYLYGQYENGEEEEGRMAYVRLFSIIALFVLLIACINFMNLATAQANRKLKEIGVKKVVGASPRHLILQFLSESTLLVTLAMILASFLVAVLLPPFNELTGKSLQINTFNFQIILGVFSLALATGLIAGSYPAFYLSKFQSTKALKGKPQDAAYAPTFRQGLVVFQFAVGLILLVGVFVLQGQLSYLQNKHLGYDQEHVITFEREGPLNKPTLFFSKLKELPEVIEAGGMASSILEGSDFAGPYAWTGTAADKGRKIKAPRLDYNAMEALGMEILAGRSFSQERKDDDQKIILNESAVKLMGFEEPVGQTISHGNRKVEVIGVVKDFHYGSLHQKIEPMILRYRDARTATHVLVKIKAGSELDALPKIQDLYEEFHPEFPFTYSFLDEDYQALYQAESQITVLSRYFSLIALIISCLGLFGLATYTGEQRRKEIGIRKVLGASVFEIISLLSSAFTKPVCIAIAIAIPVSYLFSQRWLTNFSYVIDLNWTFFVWPSLAVLLIAWSVVGLQTLKAALLNPVQALSQE
ncbi:MAG: ABC transporter permease [Saprospiraceae bacterium]|nr:ABC transporter permease [Saprospiraceae bacterium]